MLHPQLETFIKVAELGSFAKAAAACFRSSVSVMNQINALEDRLGVQLLTRSSHGARLTPAGRSFYSDAKKMLELAAEAERKARERANAGGRVVRIGASVLRPCKPLLDYLEKNKMDAERFRLEITAFDDKKEEFSGLLERLGEEIDCFVSPCDSVDWRERLGIFQLGVCECRVAMPRSHRLANRKSLSWEDLRGESIILLKEGASPVIDKIRAEIRERQPEIEIIDSEQYYDIDTFNLCARRGCLMEAPEIWASAHPSLAVPPAPWDCKMPYGVIYGKPAAPACREFIDALRAAKG